MEIRKYLALLWHWNWLIALAIFVSGAGAYIISYNTAPEYRSYTRLLIDQAPTTGSTSYADVLTIEKISQTYVELITTSEVLNNTIQVLALEDDDITVDKLRTMVQASAPVDTQIIDIVVEDTDPTRAQAIADEVATSFIAYIQSTQNQRYAEPITEIQVQLDELGLQITNQQTQINTLSAIENRTPEESALLSRLETILREQQSTYQRLFTNLQDLRVKAATERNNLYIIEPAPLNERPIRPQTTLNVILAIVVGGMSALGLIFFLDYIDDTIKSPEQVLEDTGLSTIGLISFIKGEKPAQRLITQNAPRSPISEAYRAIRTNLEYASIDAPLQTFLVTSPSPSEGKSTTAANLAIVLAQADNRVILVDADLRRPSQHKIFESANNQGLTTALLNHGEPIQQHLQTTTVNNLRLMTSGPIPPNPAELLRSQRMNHVLEELKKEADIIVVDTPPTLTVTDASILASRLNGALVVCKIGSTRREALVQAFESLRKTNTNMFGVVMNHMSTGRSGYYYTQYYYRYSYDYNTDRRQQGRPASRWPKWLTNLLGRSQ
jgi:non-specific protein-tyrosine kinase